MPVTPTPTNAIRTIIEIILIATPDVYKRQYIGRGEVFANAQTGNMLLLGVHLSEGNIPAAIRYLCPVLAFTFGIALADIVRNSGIGSHLHWRQISVVAEACLLYTSRCV